VPISAFIFGGRRATTVPLVCEAFDWEHGVFSARQPGPKPPPQLSACRRSAARSICHAAVLRLPHGRLLCALAVICQRTEPTKLPKIFFVNWFRKSATNRWLWPGYGENSRVLKWICQRIDGTGQAIKTPIGYLPNPEALDLTGLNISAADLAELLAVDTKAWLQEADAVAESYQKFGQRLPSALTAQLQALRQRLQAT
jgi:phosphoenolpyruvate carboxykinase (GTP)